jgi:hypothetical protein
VLPGLAPAICRTGLYAAAHDSSAQGFPIAVGFEWRPGQISPASPDPRNRPQSVLVELDKTRVYHKTKAELAAFSYPSSGKLVILTQADDCEPCPSIDTIVFLGA